ncbi:hypothetical protein J3A83DRAFT_1049650 [Scleroderma citrinum]
MVSPSTIPKHSQVLAIGGGLTGSYIASVLAREGLQVVLLKSTQLPRYHIGESLVPSVRCYLKFIGVEQQVADYGFTLKVCYCIMNIYSFNNAGIARRSIQVRSVQTRWV